MDGRLRAAGGLFLYSFSTLTKHLKKNSKNFGFINCSA